MQLLHTINNKLKGNLRFRVTLLLFSLLLIILREPEMFFIPRIWAEEGSIFYAFARHHSVWDIFTTAHVGYLTLFNSIVSTTQTRLFSIENAPIVSTYMGLLIQLIPLYIIIFTSNKFWDNSLKKIICVFSIIIVTSPELWLNTTNSHFILGLITFLIMLITPSTLSAFQRYFFRFLILIGGLTGPASIFFTPTFLLKAYKEKSKEKYIQAGIITLCAIIQAGVILYAIFYNNTYKRLAVHDLILTRYRFIIDNFTLLIRRPSADYQVFSTDLIILFGILIGCFYTYLLIKNRRNIEYLIPLLSFIVVGVLSTLGSLGMGGGTRYAYIPTCILMIVFLSAFFDRQFKYIHYVVLLVFTFSLTVNTFWYKPVLNEWAYVSEYPVWKSEVAKWRVDSSYKPKIHPIYCKDDDWSVKL